FGFEWSINDPSIFRNYKKVRYQSHYEDIWSWLHTDQEIVDKIFFTKAIDWQYEDEYRIIRKSSGKEIYDPSSLKEIIFGSSMRKENISLIISECKKNNLNPKYYKAELDIEKYQINIREYQLSN
ncbi:hypothetical protein J9332_25150, partial [Aquimarina celericrescens]|nr:hypothetical protein [Aquimarina celericrescens]